MAGVRRSPPVFSMEMGVIIRTSNWIAEEEKLEGIHNCDSDCTLYKKLLLDRLNYSPKWGRIKVMQMKKQCYNEGKLSDKRFSAGKKAKLTMLKS